MGLGSMGLVRHHPENILQFRQAPRHGQITSIQSGDTFTDNPTITVDTSGGAVRVDVLAYYDGYDTDGDGNFADYQRNYHRSSFSDPMGIKKHVGTDNSSPFAVTWNTQWVPDQGVGSRQTPGENQERQRILVCHTRG